MTKSKKEAYLTMGIVGGILYLLLIFLTIHVFCVMREKPGLTNMQYLEQGAMDMLRQPFAILPFPAESVRVILVITLLLGVAAFLMISDAKMKAHYNTDTVQGEARWLSDLNAYNKRFTEPFGKTTHEGPNNMILCRDLFMSMDNKKTRRNSNVFVIGGSGAGKSYQLVGPNLMQANGSYVITDPSGGLFQEFGSFFEYMGMKVKCLNLTHMDRGNHYNPLNYIEDDKDVESLVNTLIRNTTPPDQKSSDPFWEKSETALLVALISYLVNYTAKEYQNFTNVMVLLRLADVDEEGGSSNSTLDLMFQEVEEKNPDSFAVKQYKTFKMGAGKTLKSILISCAVRLQAFDLKDVADLTMTDDLDLDTIGDEKTALFIIIPTADRTFNFIVSMLYSQLFQRLYSYCENTAQFSQLVVDSDEQVWKTFRANNSLDSSRAKKEAEAFFNRAKESTIVPNKEFGWFEIRSPEGELVGYRGSLKEAEIALGKLKKGRIKPNAEQSNHGQRLPIHTRMMMDEFANIGKVNMISEVTATCRKYDLSVTLIVQSVQQMKNLYEKDWETISGNCDNTIYLGGGADTVTAEWISKLLGKETRVVMNMSYGKQGGSTSLNRTGVELYAPSQLRTMEENECIVLPKSLYAFKGLKYDPNAHPRRKLVLELMDKTGGFRFDPNKTEYFIREQDAMARIIQTHGEIEKEDEAEQKKREEAQEQRAEEFRNNEDCNGDPLIGEPQAIDEEDDGLAETMKLSKDGEAEQASDDTLQLNEEIWDHAELLYESEPAAM